MNIIIDVLGTPQATDLEFITDQKALDYLGEFQ
jgi:hypothetical protein